MKKRNYFNHIAQRWEKEHRIQNEQDRIQNLFTHLSLQAGDWVLDAGCGTGRLVPFIKKKCGPSGIIVEMDFSEEMLKFAKKKYNNSNIHFIQSDAQALSLKNMLFDVIICFALFPHIQDKSCALEEFHRILKPGKTLYIIHTMSRKELNHFHAHVKGPVCSDYLPDEGEMHQLFSAVGFSGLHIINKPALYIAKAQA
jgi:demethylmenaquinone methyltransferase/2-methoxy-6-polyprenyl-1,4-benzoquinol methylase